MPAVRAQHIARPRLLESLRDADAAPLVVLQAPAGYGKSCLLAELLQTLLAERRPVAAVALRSAGVAAFEALATALLGPAGRRSPRLCLIVDDADLLHGEAALALLRELLERGPPGLRIVAGTRRHLELGLARRRAQGALLELGAADLAFDDAEAGQLLATLGAGSAARVATQQLAHGWPVALRLLSLPAGRHAVRAFFDEELLATLDAPRRAELEAMAVVARNSGPLLEALLPDCADGLGLLRRAEADGLFILPRDVEREDFAMHPLLREHVLAALARRDRSRLHGLHLAASAWLEAQGQYPEAIDHALQAGEPALAATVFDRHSDDFYSAGLEQSILPCALRLPPALREQHPRILMAMSWRLQAELQLDQSRELLVTARQRIEALAAAGNCPPAELQFFRHQLMHRRITQAQCEGDFDFVVKQGDTLLRQYPDASPYVRCSLYAAMLHAQREHYELGQLARLESQARAQLEQVPSRYVLVFLEGIAAPGRLMRGQVDALIEGLEQALALAIEIAGEASALGAVAGLPLAEARLERNETARARALLDRYLPQATAAGFEDQLISGWLSDARLRRDAGDMAGALARLEETTSFATARGLQRLRTRAVAAAIHLHCRLGNRDEAAALAAAIALRRPASAPVPEARLTRTDAARAMAWTHLAAMRGHHDEALAVARRWRSRLATAGALRDRLRWDLRIATLQAALGDERAARRSLHQALTAGAPARLVGAFTDEAEVLLPLLPEPLPGRPADDFQSRFLAEVRIALQTATGHHIDTPVPMPAPVPAVDGLTQREIRILRLVGTGLLNGEIGAQLGLTEGSVKWYLQRIYDKVGTRRRLLAVESARRRGLLS